MSLRTPRTTALSLVTVGALVVGITATGTPSSPETDPGGGQSGPVARAGALLQPAQSCDDLLDHLVTQGLEHVGPWGLAGEMMPVMDMAAADGAERAESAPQAAQAAEDHVAGTDYSTTNVQEVDVDEPDVVKTDGRLLVIARDQHVSIVDTDTSAVVGRVDVDDMWGLEVMLSGTDLLVTGYRDGGFRAGPAADAIWPVPGLQRAGLVRVDLSDPAAPVIVGQTVIEGTVHSMRMVDDTVRVVVESSPTGLEFDHPTNGGLQAEQDAVEHNRQVLRDSRIEDWLPHRQIMGPDGELGDVEPLLDCGDVAIPSTFQGFGIVSVVTMDITGTTMEPTSAAGVLASGETVYASTDRLVVATSPWGQWRQPFIEDAADGDSPDDDQVTTQLHAFDITDPSSTRWVASGEVPGVLVNQFALSEVDGTVRVATTLQPNWWGRGSGESESAVVVLEEQGSELVEVGRVDGMGLTERIYSVRYLSPDLVALVTFRETDPLYLVDTSDPTNPQVTGELKIPGFSTYLHPIGDGLLVGLGQDATDDGRTTGLQLSLFDVTDLSDPRRIDKVTFTEGWSPAEQDHRAFLWWAQTGRVVIPAELYPPARAGESPDERWHRKPFVGLLAVDVDGTSMTKGPRINLGSDGDAWMGYADRSVVIGDDLWAIGVDVVTRLDLSTLEREAQVDL